MREEMRELIAEKAIVYLKTHGGTSKDFDKALAVAIEALEKEVPASPATRQVTFVDENDCVRMINKYVCPSCGDPLVKLSTGGICPNPKCRRAIDQSGFESW